MIRSLPIIIALWILVFPCAFVLKYADNPQHKDKPKTPWVDFIPNHNYVVYESSEMWFNLGYNEEVMGNWMMECIVDPNGQHDYWYKLEYSKNKKGQLIVEIQMSNNLHGDELIWGERKIRGIVEKTKIGFDIHFENGKKVRMARKGEQPVDHSLALSLILRM